MLIEFRVGNFRSFADPQTFSLVASTDPLHPNHCVPFGKLSLLKSAAIYGANASGKSNLIKALAFFQWFILSSATTMNVGDEIPVVPFHLKPELRDKPSFFELTFAVDGVRYQYGFEASQKRIHDEWLIAYPHRRSQQLLDRQYLADTEQTNWTFRGELQKPGSLLRERTRDNGLALSRGAELNIPPLTDVFLWIRQRMSVFDLSASPVELIVQTAKRIKSDAELRGRVVRLIRHADLGIVDLDISDQPNGWTPGTMPPVGVEGTSARILSRRRSVAGIGGYSRSRVEGETTSPRLSIRSTHQMPSGEKVEFNFLEAESNGTQRFFALAGPLLDALDQGSLLVIDELDCSTHPLLTRKLVELFQSQEANMKGAQLVFSTHDSALFDRGLFRRDQLWTVEKDAAGASRLSSLYDFDEKPRNDESLQRRYLAGRYGGVPVFGPTFEDLELK